MKGQIIKIRCLKYKIECIALIIIVLMAQVSVRPRIVRADESVSLAEYVLTLFASMGVGISNEKIINAMNQYMNIDINLGSQSIQNAISQCESAVGSQFITNTFKSTNDTTQEYVEEVGDANIDGMPDYSATATENIVASIDNYNNYGFVSIVEGGQKLAMGVPLVKLAEMVGNVAAIAWEKFSSWTSKVISGGLSLTEKDLAGGFRLGTGAYQWDAYNTSYSPYFYCDRGRSDVIVGHYADSGGEYIWIVNNGSQYIAVYDYYFSNNGRYSPSSGKINPRTYQKMYARGNPAPNGKHVWGGVYGDPADYVGKAKPVNISPDIITTDGNAVPGSHRPTFSHNSEKPYLEPIDMDDYLQWADDANENTSNGDTGEQQGNQLIILINNYYVVQTDPDGVPQGDLNDPNPVYPSQPTYIPYPTADPVASPTPATEVVPAPTLTPEELGQELEDKTIRNLGNVFPFCIPFDIVNMFKKMYVPRKAPVITWETNFGQFGSAGTVTIDFSMFDSAASVCRTFELILFILGLMMATKNLIGWGG